MLAGQNILILGGDRRGKTQHNANGTEGQGPPRADTIMVLHASLTSFRKLSIPRDSYAAIPNCGSQKINASLACNTQSTNGNPAETIKTVENFLGIDINHIVIVDFDGFASFINTLGGVTINVPGHQRQEERARRLRRRRRRQEAGRRLAQAAARRHHAAGRQGARLRANQAQQLRPRARTTATAPPASRQVLNAIKGRLTSITRFPYNFIKGPWIGWNAPKAFISDMGGFTLPQVAIAAILGGNGQTNVLGGSGRGQSVSPARTAAWISPRAPASTRSRS